MTVKKRMAELNDRYRGKSILIINDHEKAGTNCLFIEMVQDEHDPYHLLMEVQEPNGNHLRLMARNVFLIKS